MIFVNIYGLKNITRAIKKHSFGIGGGRWCIVRFSKTFLWKSVTERGIYQIYTYFFFPIKVDLILWMKVLYISLNISYLKDLQKFLQMQIAAFNNSLFLSWSLVNLSEKSNNCRSSKSKMLDIILSKFQTEFPLVTILKSITIIFNFTSVSSYW